MNRHISEPVKDELRALKRAHIHATQDIGARWADAVASSMGSWKFIIIQSLVVTIWIVANLVLLTHTWDPYPFILLNLLFSTQAAYSAPVIMMSQNRQAAKDRARDDRDDAEIGEMLEIIHTLHALQIEQMAHDKSSESSDRAILIGVKQLLGRKSANGNSH